MITSGVKGRAERLPGLSGTVRIQLTAVDGTDLTGVGHRQSVITSVDSSWTHGIHNYSYDDPNVHARLYAIANSVVPEVMMVTWSGSAKVRTERVWVTAVQELPGRAQGSREMRVETVDLLWAMNRYHKTRAQSGSISEIVAAIAADYGMESVCNSTSAIAYVQSCETDLDFLSKRLRQRALTPPPEHGDFRISLRYKANGSPVLCFAPLRATDREFNWWFMNLSDPNLGLNGPMEFVNQTPVRMALGAAGVRTLVVDPYNAVFRDQFSFATHVEVAAPEGVHYSTSAEKNIGLTGRPTDAIRHYHVVTDTLQEDGPQGALALAVATAEAARMGNYEALFTINSQPWLTPGDRVTLRAATPTLNEHDWFVSKCVTTIAAGACTTHVTMVTDEPQPTRRGVQVQSADNPNAQLTAPAPTPVAPAASESGSGAVPVSRTDQVPVTPSDASASRRSSGLVSSFNLTKARAEQAAARAREDDLPVKGGADDGADIGLPPLPPLP